MTTNDERDMRGADNEPGPAPHAITCQQAQSGYRSTIDARERFEELSSRDLSACAIAMLKARGAYDPQRHGDAVQYPPLTAHEHLEVLAAGEMLARHYRHPAHIHRAVQAGASWTQIAVATCTEEATARQQYREWADGQRRLHIDYHGQFGMDAAAHADAIRRASNPSPQPGK